MDEAIALCDENEDAYREFRNVLLVFEILVGRDEDLVPFGPCATE